MDAQAIKWLPNDVHQHVFFTREAFEKYSLRNRLEEVILEKEKELFPQGRVVAKPAPQIDVTVGAVVEPNPPSPDVTDNNPTSESMEIVSKHEPHPKHELQTSTATSDAKPEITDQTNPIQKPQRRSSGSECDKRPKKELGTAPTEPEKSAMWVVSKTDPEEVVLPKPTNQRMNERPASWYSKLPYPRPSWLTMEEQRLYLEYLTKLQKGQHRAQEGKDLQRLKEIQHKVLAEQEEFQAYSEESANAYPEKYHNIDPDAERYIDTYVSSLCKRALHYPQYYVQLDSVPISLPKVPTFIPFIHVKCLLKIGDIPKVILPNIDYPPRPKVSADPEKLSERYPPVHDPNAKPTCSRDENMERLAMKYAAQVSISSAGLKCLLDHGRNYDRQWELPVVIKDHIIKDERGHRRHKVIYIDKPFPPRSMNASTKNAWYYKFTTKISLLHPNHPSTQSFSTHRHDQATPQDDTDDLFADVADTDLETFGTNTGVTSAFKKYVREPKNVPVVKVDLEGEDVEEGEGSKGGPLFRSGSEGFCVNQGTSGDLLNAVLTPVTSPQPEAMKDRPKLLGFIPANMTGSHGEIQDKIKEARPRDDSKGEEIDDVMSSEVSMETKSIGVDKNKPESEICGEIEDGNKSKQNVDSGCKKPPTETGYSAETKAELKNGQGSGSSARKGSEELDQALDTSTDDDRLQIDLPEGEEVIEEEREVGRLRRRTRTSLQTDDNKDELNTVGGRRRTRSQVQKLDQGLNKDGEGEKEEVKKGVDGEKGSGGIEGGQIPVKKGRGRPRKIKPGTTETQEVDRDCAGLKRAARGSSDQEDCRLGKRRSTRLASLGQEHDKDGEIESKRQRCTETSTKQTVEDKKTSASPFPSTDFPTSPLLTLDYPTSPPPVPSQAPPLLSTPKIIPLSPEKRPSNATPVSPEQEQKTLLNPKHGKNTPVSPKQGQDVKISERRLPQPSRIRQRQGSSETRKSSSFAFDKVMAAQKQMLAHQVAPENKEESLASVEAASLSAKSTLPQSDPNAWRPSEDPNHYQLYDQPNLSYNLWLLGNTRLLIRSGLHGVHKPSKKKQVNEMNVTAKVDHQTFFGVEQSTYSDSARAWVDTHVKNVQKLTRVRINAYNSEIVYIEQLGIGDIFNARSHFNPVSAMSVVNGILEKLKSLPEGHYMLGHSPGNLHAHIKKNVSTTRGVYDLHKAYIGRQVALVRNDRPAWMPIDTSILLYHHKKHNRIPATFEPKDSRYAASTTMGHTAKKPYKKKNKKKKKKR